MKSVKGIQVNEVLQRKVRTYLCGHHLQDEGVDYLDSEQLEIGISRYTEFTAEKPHRHQWNHEYNLVVKGKVKVYVFGENKEYVFEENDLYMVEPGMDYVTKAMADSEVVFMKIPGGNDKELIEMTPEIEEWLRAWEHKIMK